MRRPHGFDRDDELPEHVTPESSDLASDEALGTIGVSPVTFSDDQDTASLDSSTSTADTGETEVLWTEFGAAHPPSAPESHKRSRELSRLLQPGKLRMRAAGEESRREDPVRQAKRELKMAARARRRQERRERRRFSAESRRQRRSVLIVLGAIAALAVFVLAGVVTPLTAVREVQVAGASLVAAEDVQASLEGLTGTPLALVDDAEVHRLLEPFPLIQRYAIERIPPHTLKVRIEERVPVLSIEDDGEYRLYDPAGVLVATAAERPEGVALGTDRVTETASESFAVAATVLRDMPADLRERVAQAHATSGQDLGFVLTSGEEIVWGDAEQTQRKAVVLTAMLTALEGETVEVIDVSSSEAPVFQ